MEAARYWGSQFMQEAWVQSWEISPYSVSSSIIKVLSRRYCVTWTRKQKDYMITNWSGIRSHNKCLKHTKKYRVSWFIWSPICSYFSYDISYTHTHTHTHTHTRWFYGLRGLSIGVMVFILYKLYVLLPYTYPTPKLSPHRRRCISIFPQKNSLCMIYKRFKLWGHWKCPHKSPSPCNTYVIPMSKFVSS